MQYLNESTWHLELLPYLAIPRTLESQYAWGGVQAGLQHVAVRQGMNNIVCMCRLQRPLLTKEKNSTMQPNVVESEVPAKGKNTWNCDKEVASGKASPTDE